MKFITFCPYCGSDDTELLFRSEASPIHLFQCRYPPCGVQYLIVSMPRDYKEEPESEPEIKTRIESFFEDDEREEHARDIFPNTRDD